MLNGIRFSLDRSSLRVIDLSRDSLSICVAFPAAPDAANFFLIFDRYVESGVVVEVAATLV